MRIAVLPFNTKQGTDAAYGRQVSFILAEAMKTLEDIEAMGISYMARFENEGREQIALVNLSDQMADEALVTQVLQETEAKWVVDGLVEVGAEFRILARITSAGEGEIGRGEFAGERAEVIPVLTSFMRDTVDRLGLVATDEFIRGTGDFGTDDHEAFLSLLIGWDSLTYLQRAADKLPPDFDFDRPFDALVDSLRRDPDFVAPYEAIIGLSRLCLGAEIGSLEMIERSLRAAIALCDDDWRGWYMLGDLCQRTNRAEDGEAAYERSLSLNPAEASVWVRLGLMQISQGKLSDAEHSLREALTREGEDEEKTAGPYLATLLLQEGRSQDVIDLWTGLRDQDPSQSSNWTNLASTYEQLGRFDDADQTFQTALESVTDTALVHRHYATYLTRREMHVEALEQFEHAIPFMPYDHSLMAEYAVCLFQNGKTEELKEAIKLILASEPPPDLRAQTVAWQMEIETPQKLERFNALMALVPNEPERAVEGLEQLAAWLSDYWKLWLALSHAHNALGNHPRAEQAAVQLIQMYPGCEPAYGELAGALFRQDRAEDAYQLLRRTVRQYPQFLTVMGNLGMAAKLTGRQEEALQVADGLSKFIKQVPAIQELVDKIREAL
jgi:Flp pilus assembly protein TadD